MRIGQGFNSYTQAICLDNAVTFTGEGGKPQTQPDTTRIPQVVTYSSHFVEKYSDVVKALNVSAQLTVKMGGVGGSGSGSYVDERKIKESDINFMVKVKVVNQNTLMRGKAEFNEIPGLPRSKFGDIYGDTFISGFLVGGEFVAILSIKVNDQSKLQDIKASLELSFSQVQASGAGGYREANASYSSETSISVNWSGGGKVKEPDSKWDVASMLKAAAGFPDACARAPQRIAAILTKYEKMESFLRYSMKFDTLSYENAGVYTYDLLDDYMNYKIHLGNIRIMQDEMKAFKKSTDPDAYNVTPEGLDLARRDALRNMVIIVQEVDTVTKNPSHAQESIAKSLAPYLNSTVYQDRLPIRIVDPFAPVSDDVKQDPKRWMWVKFAGRDSSGGDVEETGLTDPDEIMRKVYQWELANANPPRYIKSFNTAGVIKEKCGKAGELVSNAKTDLYIRIFIDDQWHFAPGVDSPDNDIKVDGFNPTTDLDHQDLDIVEAFKTLKTRTDIIAFNSMQRTKNRVNTPMNSVQAYQGRPHQGIWIRKSTMGM